MKIILSRKGFDSANGGIVSPIFEDGTMISFPIPGDDEDNQERNTMTFICYHKCTTCQKAQKWLDENGISYTFRDIKMENPTYNELTAWHERSGLPLKRFFNTSGLLYKSMGLKDKLPQMSEDEMLKRLAADGMLVKRPLLVGDDFVLVGFKEAEWESRLKPQ